MSRGLYQSQLDVVSVPTSADTEGLSPEEEAQVEVGRELVEVWLRSRYFKPLAATNVVVSLLLVVAGFQLLRRRKAAVWWTTQATLANGLLAIVEVVAVGHAFQVHWDEIESAAGAHGEITSGGPMGAVQGLGIAVLLHLMAYAFMAWRVRRPDIAGLLSEAPSQGN